MGRKLTDLSAVFSSFLCVCTFAHSLNEIRDRSLNGTTNGQQKVPFLIGIAGGSASGKVSYIYFIKYQIKQNEIHILSIFHVRLLRAND